MWCPKIIKMPMIVIALGMIKKRSDKHIKNLPGSPRQYEIQKTALYGNAHLIRRVILK